MLELLPFSIVILTSAALALGPLVFALLPAGQGEVFSGGLELVLGLVGLLVGMGLGAGLRRTPRDLIRGVGRGLVVSAPVVLGAWALLGCVIQARTVLDLMAVAPIALIIAAAALAAPVLDRDDAAAQSLAPAAALVALGMLISLKGSPSAVLGFDSVPAGAQIVLGVFIGGAVGLCLCRLPASSARARHMTLAVSVLAVIAVSLGLGLPSLWVSFGLGAVLGFGSKSRRRFIRRLERLQPRVLLIPLVLQVALWTPITLRALLLGVGFAAALWVCARLVDGLWTPRHKESRAEGGVVVVAALLGQSWDVWRRPGIGADIVGSITKGEHSAESAPVLVTDVHSALFVGVLMLVLAALGRRD